MPLAHDPVAEEQFRSYTALLDLQERLKTAIKVLEKDSHFYQEAPESILEQTIQITHKITILLDTVKEAASHIKTKSVEERGYKIGDRGIQGFSSSGSCNCDSNCGSGCGSNSSGCGGGCNP